MDYKQLFTDEELLAAANRADVYPPGHGFQYYVNQASDYDQINSDDAAEAMRLDPALLAIGSPEVAIAATRGPIGGSELYNVLLHLAETLRIPIPSESNFVFNYCHLLNKDPAAVARRIRNLLDARSEVDSEA